MEQMPLAVNRLYRWATPYKATNNNFAEIFNKAYIAVSTMNKGQSGFKASDQLDKYANPFPATHHWSVFIKSWAATFIFNDR